MGQSITQWEWLQSLVAAREHAVSVGDWPAVVQLHILEGQAIGLLGPAETSPLHRPFDAPLGE